MSLRVYARSLVSGLLLLMPVVIVAPAISVLMPSVAIAQDQDQKPPFFDRLSPYGIWLDHPVYGAVWTPAVADDSFFRPYQDGRWIYTVDWGWYFEASQPWGDITFHYGRWTFDQDDGWIWVPGRDWAPAWVSWRTGQHSVGWAPIGPRGEDAADAAYWTFVDDSQMGSSRIVDVSQVVYDRRRARAVFLASQFIGHPQIDRPINLFVNIDVLKRRSRVVVRPQVIEYRVALDREGRPIGWHDRWYAGRAPMRYQPARADRDAAPDPFVTERLLFDIRSGRVRENDRYARGQVVEYARRGEFQFQDQQHQGLVDRNAPVAIGAAAIAIFNAARSQNVTISGKELPPPTSVPRVVKLQSPDDLNAHPNALGVPPAVRQFQRPTAQANPPQGNPNPAPTNPNPANPPGQAPASQPRATVPQPNPASAPAVPPPAQVEQPRAPGQGQPQSQGQPQQPRQPRPQGQPQPQAQPQGQVQPQQRVAPAPAPAPLVSPTPQPAPAPQPQQQRATPPAQPAPPAKPPVSEPPKHEPTPQPAQRTAPPAPAAPTPAPPAVQHQAPVAEPPSQRAAPPTPPVQHQPAIEPPRPPAQPVAPKVEPPRVQERPKVEPQREPEHPKVEPQRTGECDPKTDPKHCKS